MRAFKILPSAKFNPRLSYTTRNYTYSSEELGKMSLDEWANTFRKETIDVAKMDIGSISYDESANRMRKLLRSGILRHDDIIRRPERFFLAHRLLAFHSPQLGPGFWIRFTVHYNLCMGSIVGLGSSEQVDISNGWQKEGYLGCFSLTEKFAGVNSGLVVNTVVEYDDANKDFPFVLNTPTEGAKKNWISQGLVADKTTVVADLRMNGKSLGPHAFMVSLREGGKLVPGVSNGDMGRKTVGNDLDNAWIGFSNLRLPKDALLSRYADIVDGKYVQKEKNMPVFHMIGQRLFTGRVAVAQAALEFRKRIFEMTKQYTDSKKCWSPSGTGEVTLTSIPHLNALYAEADERLKFMESFVSRCETQLTEILRSNKQPSIELVEAIAVAKVKAVEDSIQFVHRLKNDVGSYALMARTGFDQADFLTCCKFAEGDSRVLMQKMSRDRMRVFSKNPGHASATLMDPSWDNETKKCFLLQASINKEALVTGDKNAAWDNHYQQVYELADAIMLRTIKNFMK